MPQPSREELEAELEADFMAWWDEIQRHKALREANRPPRQEIQVSTQEFTFKEGAEQGIPEPPADEMYE